MQDAAEKLVREKKARLDIIREQMGKGCTTGCNKDWLKCALEVLKQNNQHPYVYAAAIRDLVVNGRGKFRNIMIIGPANSGKLSC